MNISLFLVFFVIINNSLIVDCVNDFWMLLWFLPQSSGWTTSWATTQLTWALRKLFSWETRQWQFLEWRLNIDTILNRLQQWFSSKTASNSQPFLHNRWPVSFGSHEVDCWPFSVWWSQLTHYLLMFRPTFLASLFCDIFLPSETMKIRQWHHINDILISHFEHTDLSNTNLTVFHTSKKFFLQAIIECSIMCQYVHVYGNSCEELLYFVIPK